MKKYILCNKKILAIVGAVLIGCMMSVGGALAYFNNATDNLDNSFDVGKVNVGVVIGTATADEDAYEELKDGTLTEEKIEQGVSVKNIDLDTYHTVDTYVRVQLVYIWRSTDGFEGIPIEVTPTVNLDANDAGEWFLGDDGYYYYTKAIEPGEVTDVLLEGVSYDAPDDSEGYLEVQFLVDAVQGTSKSMVTTAWGNALADKLI